MSKTCSRETDVGRMLPGDDRDETLHAAQRRAKNSA